MGRGDGPGGLSVGLCNVNLLVDGARYVPVAGVDRSRTIS